MEPKDLIRDVPGFPKDGILFRDITPLLGEPAGFRTAVNRMLALFAGEPIDKVAGIESRGFLFGPLLAYQLGVGFVPIRKPKKLPREVLREEYALEYGTDSIEMHVDAVKGGERVLVVDDLIATGGTALAAARLVERGGGRVAGFGFVVELAALGGRERLHGYEVKSLVVY